MDAPTATASSTPALDTGGFAGRDSRYEGPGGVAWAVLPYALIGLSLAATLAVGAPTVPAWSVPWLVAASAALVVFRIWWQRATVSASVRWAMYFVQLLIVLFAVCLSGFFAIAAFVGYLDLPEVSTRKLFVPALIATGSITALGQAGGARALVEWPLFYVILVVVNVGVGGTMMVFERNRRETLEKLAATVEELRASERRNEVLRAQVVEQARVAGVLEERQRLSREMHDTVAQGLVAVITQLEGAEAAEPGTAEARTRLGTAQASARESLGEVRRAVHALASPRLDDVDLPAALERLVTGWGVQHGVDARVNIDGNADRVRHDADLLRVAQESLANVARHAGASRVVVTLTALPDSTRLDVRDDGRGFDPRAATTGRGLDGMRRRVAEIGGSLAIESEPGAGCTVSAAVPA